MEKIRVKEIFNNVYGVDVITSYSIHYTKLYDGITEKSLEIGKFVDIKVTGYGRRSITGKVIK